MRSQVDSVHFAHRSNGIHLVDDRRMFIDATNIDVCSAHRRRRTTEVWSDLDGGEWDEMEATVMALVHDSEMRPLGIFSIRNASIEMDLLDPNEDHTVVQEDLAPCLDGNSLCRAPRPRGLAQEAREREASEQEAVREIARLFGKVFSIDDTLDLPSLLRGAQEGVSRGLNEVTEDTKAKIEAFFNLQPGYFSGIMAHGLVRGLQSAMSSTLGNAANALFRDKKESHRDVQWYSLDPFPPSPPTLRQPTPPPGWEPEALRDQEVSEMCPPSPLLPHIQF